MKKRALYIIIGILFLTASFQWQAKSSVGQQPTYLDGTFLILWGDGPAENPVSMSQYFLAVDSGEHIELEFSPPLVMGPSLLSLNHQAVVVSGDWLQPSASDSRVFRVDQIEMDETREAEPKGVFGHQPWVSIMCKFSDYTIEPKDLTYFQNMFSSSYPGLDHYWREQSFDLVDLVGSGAFGWYTLPYTRSHYVPPSGYMDWWSAAADCTAVADDYIDYSQYVGINLMFNADLDGYAWGGTWDACLDGVCKNWRTTWEPPWGYGNIGVIAHENGHGFGLPHSSGDYGEVYDNAWDVMSDLWSNGNRGAVDPVYGTMGQHTIAYHKGMLEWIDSDHMAVIYKGEQRTLTIERIAQPLTDAALGAKILINNSPNLFYTVESRSFAGYDSWLPGEAVIIHNVDVYRSEPAHVVDIDNNGNTGDEGAMWRVGEIFEDTDNCIRVTVDSATDSGFVVTIENNIPIDTVNVSGYNSGRPGVEYIFTADALPVNATEPITYVWEATGQLPITHTNGVQDQASFTWSEPGTQNITVTASNVCSLVTDTYTIEVRSTPPASVNITGPLNGVVGIEQVYHADVLPITATLPITYVWKASGQETLTQTGGLTDTVTYTWHEPGEQVIDLLAINAMGEVTTTFTTAVITPELGVEISGTISGYSGQEYLFTAQVSPITATQPLTYTWITSGMEPVTHTNGLSDTITLNLDSAGKYLIMLQVSNRYVTAHDSWEIGIVDRIFIPLINK